MTKEEALLDGWTKTFVHIKTSDDRIEFCTTTGFGSLFTKELKTDNGQTVGERNRAELHARLDAWIDKTWEDS